MSAKNCEGDHVYFGDKDSSSLVIKVGDGAKLTLFHVHWEMLASAFEYFAKMRLSNLAEAQTNVVCFSNDDPAVWRVVMNRCYPPVAEYTVESALSILPLAKFLDSAWLIDEVETFMCGLPESQRKVEILEALVEVGRFSRVLAAWFGKSSGTGYESDWVISATPSYARRLLAPNARAAMIDYLLAALKNCADSYYAATANGSDVEEYRYASKWKASLSKS
jgi:BTB/POZ domain